MKAKEKARLGRLLAKANYVGAIVLFVIGVSLAFLLIDYTKQNRETLVQICESSNQLRTAERKLWDYILTLPPSPSLNEEQKVQREKNIADFVKFLDANFALRDCGEI